MKMKNEVSKLIAPCSNDDLLEIIIAVALEIGAFTTQENKEIAKTIQEDYLPVFEETIKKKWPLGPEANPNEQYKVTDLTPLIENATSEEIMSSLTYKNKDMKESKNKTVNLLAKKLRKFSMNVICTSIFYISGRKQWQNANFKKIKTQTNNNNNNNNNNNSNNNNNNNNHSNNDNDNSDNEIDLTLDE